MEELRGSLTSYYCALTQCNAENWEGLSELLNVIINIPEEETDFILFNFTDDLNLGEAANTTQDRNNKGL